MKSEITLLEAIRAIRLALIDRSRHKAFRPIYLSLTRTLSMFEKTLARL